MQLREVQTAADFRAMWDTIERLWAQATERAGRLPAAALAEQVNEEWSFEQTLRHLVFITDAWASRTVLDEPMPYHPLGLPNTGYPPADAAALGLDLDARPSLEAMLEARGTRMTLVRGIVDGLTDAGLERACLRLPAPGFQGYPEETLSVGRCLRVIMKEECEHRRYAARDLAALEADPDSR